MCPGGRRTGSHCPHPAPPANPAPSLTTPTQRRPHHGAQAQKGRGTHAVLLPLRPRVCVRGDAARPPEECALEVPHLLQKADVVGRPGNARGPGAPCAAGDVHCRSRGVDWGGRAGEWAARASNGRLVCGHGSRPGSGGAACTAARTAATPPLTRPPARPRPRRSVPGAKPGKDDPELNIYGMTGVPEGAVPGGEPGAQGGQAGKAGEASALFPFPRPSHLFSSRPFRQNPWSRPPKRRRPPRRRRRGRRRTACLSPRAATCPAWPRPCPAFLHPAWAHLPPTLPGHLRPPRSSGRARHRRRLGSLRFAPTSPRRARPSRCRLAWRGRTLRLGTRLGHRLDRRGRPLLLARHRWSACQCPGCHLGPRPPPPAHLPPTARPP